MIESFENIETFFPLGSSNISINNNVSMMKEMAEIEPMRSNLRLVQREAYEQT